MADTLETIYLNNSLGETELADNKEHTILTTDANTSYVLKDMYINNPSLLSENSYLELNGFNVSSLSANATGSLIVGPNSTLKIKTDTFPLIYEETKTYAISPTDKGYYEKSIDVVGGTSPTVVDSYGSSMVGTLSYTNVIKDIDYEVINGVPYFHYTTTDGNSVQRIYANNGNTGGSFEYIYQNYVGVGIARSDAYGYIAVYNNGSTFYYSDLNAYPTSPNWQPWRSSVSPYPTSSYPRSMVAYGYFWYIPDSGYNNQIYALNIETGGFIQFTNLGNSGTAGSSYLDFGISYDSTTDKFIIYRPDSSGSVYVSETAATKTYLDTITGAYNESSGTNNYGMLNFPSAYQTSYMGPTTMFGDNDGNISYRNTSNEMVTMNKSMVEVKDRISMSGVTLDGNTFDVAADNLFKQQKRIITSQEAIDAGLATPTFGIQILGVKSSA